MKLVDLSYDFTAKLSKYEESDKASFITTKDYQEYGYKESNINLDTHVGTHIDAPSHLYPDGKLITDFDVNFFHAKVLIVDVSEKEIVNFDLSQLEGIEGVFFRTGFSKYFGTSKYQEHPYISEALANKLSEYNLKMIGIEGFGVDKYNASDLIVHKILLKNNNSIIIENLTNLASLPRVVEVICLPLKASLEGGPARVVALI